MTIIDKYDDMIFLNPAESARAPEGKQGRETENDSTHTAINRVLTCWYDVHMTVYRSIFAENRMRFVVEIGEIPNL